MITPKPGIYGWSPQCGGVHFHRIEEPLRVASNHGIRTATGQIIDDRICEEYDTILVHMLHGERNSQAWEKLARADSHRLIYDIDDAMWAPDWLPFIQHYDTRAMFRVYRNMELAHVVTTPSEVIAEHLAGRCRRVVVCPNTVPEEALSIKRVSSAMREQHFNAVTIGYQGSSSHAEDFTPQIMKDLESLYTLWPYTYFKFYGQVGLSDDRIKYFRWQSPGMEYYRNLFLDIGIGPLKNSYFNRCKSGLRAIEFSALGIVPVLSDLPIYRDYVRDDTGVLVKKGESWYEAIRPLVEDKVLRKGMQEKGRLRAAEWTTEKNIGNWVYAWNQGGDPSALGEDLRDNSSLLHGPRGENHG
jgi:glycosyltransferase involved in cell wall biosynthesis